MFQIPYLPRQFNAQERQKSTTLHPLPPPFQLAQFSPYFHTVVKVIEIRT